MSNEVRNRALSSEGLPKTPDRIRVFLLTNELDRDHAAGQKDGFVQLQKEGHVESFSWAAPKILAKTNGVEQTLRDVLEMARAAQPNVVIQSSPHGFPYTREWLQALVDVAGRPSLFVWEGDAFSRWRKPVRPETRAWWAVADVVFTAASGGQRKLIERSGNAKVQFVPNTYDHVRYSREEANEPPTLGDFSRVTVIGNRWGRRYVSRLPGSSDRLKLVRELQKDPKIPLAIYGANWTGRGARGPIHSDDQAAVARQGLMTANWDHFPKLATSSDRLAIQLLAGRAHITTRHPSSDWLPGPRSGLFLEPTVDDVVRRVRDLLDRPREEVLELGLAAHRWVRRRLSDRELARFMLGTLKNRLLADLPADPWSQLPA